MTEAAWSFICVGGILFFTLWAVFVVYLGRKGAKSIEKGSYSRSSFSFFALRFIILTGILFLEVFLPRPASHPRTILKHVHKLIQKEIISVQISLFSRIKNDILF